LVRTIERLLRRAGLPLAVSQGFHPKPRMSFPAALAVGIEGLDEVMEIELAEALTAETVLERLTACRVRGLDFRRVEILPRQAGGKKARVSRVTYEIDVPREREDEIARRVAELLARRRFPIQRPGRSQSIDLLEFLEELKLFEGTLLMTLRVTQQANPGPRDVLRGLGLDELERRGACLRRTKVELRS